MHIWITFELKVPCSYIALDPQKEMVMHEGGLLGLVHLVLAIWAILNIIQSRASDLSKVLWAAFVFLFPIVGIIVWFFVGPRTGRR